MKKFPRLYSLCTIGIRQHQEFDYQFHGFRTDFVGDSGCGKSMIADLVQLVFVGSEVFASGTDSMDKREVEGMVLRTPGAKGTDMAYVLLNIELGTNQFLTIGAYLESTNRQSRSFIIQHGYQEADLKPLNRPLTVADIHVDDQIPTMDTFRENLEGNGFILHSYALRKKFHGFLFRHQLLSIDLSQSSRLLKDYAMIIQSFSRGKSLDISESNSLKRFLFGEEKAKEITQKFKAAVEELQLTLKEHAQNREEIKLATLKYQALNSLGDLKKTLHENEEDFLIKRCVYYSHLETETRESLRESGKDYIDAYNTLSNIRQIVDEELNFSEDTAYQLGISEEAAKKRYNQSFSLQEKLAPFTALLESNGCAVAELHEIYRQYQQDKTHFQIFKSVKEALLKSRLKIALETYLVEADLATILERVEQDINSMIMQLRQKEQLLDFASLNNEGSLGYWAIQNYQSYSLEVESLLMHYKDLPINTPDENFDQYIPNPKEMLKNDLTFTIGEEGFWVRTGAINQYIPYQPKQLFAFTDPEALKKLLASLSEDLHQQVSTLKANIDDLRALKTFIVSTENFNSYLSLRHRENELLDFQTVAALDLSRQSFEEGMLLLDDADQIQADYREASLDWNEKRQALTNYNTVLENLRKSQTSLKNLLSASITIEIIKTLTETFPQLSQDESAQQQQLTYLKSRFEKSHAKDAFIRDILQEKQHNINLQDINLQYEEYTNSVEERKEAFKEARLLLQKEPDLSPYQQQAVAKPEQEQQAYEISKSLYKNKFDDIVGQYAISESYRFVQFRNYDELCTTVLPDAFLDKKIDKENSIDVIWNYLSQINDKNKDLNNRKLHKIRDILDEVGDEVSKREDTIRQIHNFLDNGDREITGGHRVSLKTNNLHCYPKNWINNYSDKLSTENTLFAEGESLHELLGDSVSLEEKMINAFHAFGGHRGAKPRIESLLDPNSYFDLTFKMESHASGKTNIGSTGQVYAAIALLCIARLSLVNKSSFNKNPPPGIRFMPIDEAEGLGSNFDLLYEIARDFDYQILTMGIKPLGRFKEGEQYIYMLSNNKEVPEDVNYQPYGIFCEADQQF